MTLRHLPNSVPPEEAIECIREHGYVIIDELASREQMDRIQGELEPFLAKTPFGSSDITGKLTRRTGGLVARSPTARELISNTTVLALCAATLPREAGFQLSLTEVISLSPGAKAQFVHRDELAFGAYPFTNDYEVQISTLWAMTEYTEIMGATRVISGSHKLGSNAKFEVADTVPAVMKRGSALIYSGKLYHGGGENKSDQIRQALNINYNVAWLRQEENQFLSCPFETARTLPPALLRLMGYRDSQGLGRVDDWVDPLSHLLGDRKQISEEGFTLQNVYEHGKKGPA